MYGSWATLDYELELPFDEENLEAASSTFLFNSINDDQRIQFDEPIPLNTTSRIGYLHIGWSMQGTYVKTTIPINIRVFDIQVAFWTDSYAPKVFNTTQKVYMYAYYGARNDFPSQAAFNYPANLKNVSLFINSTTKNARGVETRVTKGFSNFAGVDLVNGFGAFNYTFIQGDNEYIQFRNNSKTFQITVNPINYMGNSIRSLPTL